MLTLIAPAAWPLVMAVTGWQLKVSVEGTSFTSAVGDSLVAIALQVFYLRGFRMVCVDQGLAAAHFRWREASLRLLRRELDRLAWVYLPAATVTIVAFYLDPLNAGWAIGRVAFLIMASSLALVLRCFVANVDQRMRITSELNQTINDKFNAAGIVIAFPQRDLRLGGEAIRIQLEEPPPARPDSDPAA